MRTEILSNKLLVYVEKEMYNIDVLHKCFYWYGNDFNVDINSFNAIEYVIGIMAKDDSANLLSLISKIQKDLIDFKLRDIVTKETQTIRELIIAKAFAYYELDEYPITNVSDPVGFNPNEI